jgi:hypothetical protein
MASLCEARMRRENALSFGPVDILEKQLKKRRSRAAEKL